MRVKYNTDKIKINAVLLFVSLALVLLIGGPVLTVHAADGNLSIAVSERQVQVGDTVTVTLTAAGAGGERATADMEFTYNTASFSFVSCNANDYSGGSGGSVSFRGSTVRVTLKAIAAGTCNLRVNGSNGVVSESQESLDSMVAAGASIQASTAGETGTTATANQSGDNSLSALTLSQGTLSPGFVYSTTSYTAEVPYEVTEVTVDATTSNSGAEIEDIIGNADLQVGENAIRITVRAANGARAVYTIKVTRLELAEGAVDTLAQDGQDQTIQDGLTDETTPTDQEQLWQEQEQGYLTRIELLENNYNTLDKRYTEEKTFSRTVMAVLAFVVVVLVIVCINLIVALKRKGQDDIWEEEDEKEEISATLTRALKREPARDETDSLKPKETEPKLKAKTDTKKKDIELIDLDDL